MHPYPVKFTLGITFAIRQYDHRSVEYYVTIPLPPFSDPHNLF